MLFRSIPTRPYPNASFAEPTGGVAQLGVYASTLQELVDNPLALSRPESRAFGLVVVSKLQAVNDKYGTGASLAVVRASLSGRVPDASEINPLREALSSAISTKWPLAERQAYMIGALTAQVAYNAAVLQDSGWDARFRNAIFSAPPYAGMSTLVRTDLQALKALPTIGNGGSWSAINAAASKATFDIVESP